MTISAPQPIDDARARAAGIRRIAGRHLTLYTDAAADPEIDRLPAVFDQAVPQWAAYFGVDPDGPDAAKLRGWHARAFLIKDRGPFDALGLMPPPGADRFVNGVSLHSDLWLYEQPTAYYRRHLLLHEGTHAFMVSFLGGCGPGWFMEGTAELMATHQLDEASRQLTLRTMPLHREEVPMLGRIELIHDALGENRSLEFVDVMRIDNRNLLENEAYAWSWAAAKLLDAHPRYQNRFRALKKHVLRPDFNELVRRDFETDWADLNIEWRAFVAALDHGHDFERMAIEFRRGTPLANQMQQTVTIRADRGWQSSGVWLDAGRSYHVAANGRFVISKENVGGTWHAWPSEPGGVTIAYHAGRPLGQLLGAIDNRGAGGGGPDATFANPLAIGLSTTITPAASGTLYLRVNDSSGRLGDNDGTLTVVIDAK